MAVQPPRLGAGARQRLRGTLVAAEIALALVCLVATATLIGAVRQEIHAPAGFDPAGLVTANLRLAGPAYASPASRNTFAERLEAAAKALPGARAAAIVNGSALSWDQPTVEAQGQTPPAAPGSPYKVVGVTPSYFATLQIPRLAGRGFTAADTAQGAPVAIISRTAALRLFPGAASPIGRYLRIVRPGEPAGWREVVGEVADMRFNADENDDARVNIYEPLAQAPPPNGLGVIVRGPVGADFQPQLRAALARLDASLPLYGYDTWSDLVASGIGGDRAFAWFLVGLDGLVLLATAIGLYGLVAFAAAGRRKELAIRMAIGAGRGATIRLLLAGGARLAGIGVAAGLALAWLDSYVLANAFNGLPTRTLGIFVLPAAVLLAIVFAASLIPAHRAASAAPLALLKES